MVFIKSTMKTWLSSSLGFYASQVNALANALSAWSAEHLRLDKNFSTCSYKKNKLVKKNLLMISRMVHIRNVFVLILIKR